ncbi:MAG: transcriptional regulator, partial [Clostridia bacterium]|nr:transcriptional regulator [Clostridia bacterium]
MDKLFLTLFNMSVSASVLILAVVIIRAFMKRSPKYFRCILWALVAIRLIIPSFPQTSLSVMPAPEIISEETLYDKEPEIDTGSALINDSVNPLFSGVFKTDEISSANKLQVDVYILSIIWAAGVVCMLIYAFISFLQLRRKVSASVLTERGAFICDGIRSPFILGIIRPKIFIPSSISEKEAEISEAHERAHLKRKDHLWKPIGFLLLSVYWMNPLIWLAYYLLCRDIELACDEKVLKGYTGDGIKEYAETLLSFEVKSRAITACPLAFGESGVKQRIKNVLNYKKPAFWLILSAVLICAAVCVFFMTDPLKTEIDLDPDKISGAEVYNALTVEEKGITALDPEDIAELSSTLRGINKLKRSSEYEGLTPLYAVYIHGNGGDLITLRGYDVYGFKTDAVFRGKTYVIKSDKFNKNLRDLCFKGVDIPASTSDIDSAVTRAVFDREGKNNGDAVFVESHRIIKTVEKNDKTTVYAWILSEEYVDLSKDN